MRKLLKSMKTLLVAVGLLVGTNSVWGETETYDFATWGKANMTSNSYLTISRDADVSYTLSNNATVYKLNDLVGSSTTLALNGRIAVTTDKDSWNSDAGCITFRYPSGKSAVPRLGNEAQSGSKNIAIVNLKVGNKVTITGSEFKFRNSIVVNSLGEAVTAGDVISSNETYTVVSEGNIELYNESRAWANITKLVIDNAESEANTYYYSVNAVDEESNTLKVISSGFAAEGSLPVTGISKVISKDGVFYELNDANVTNFSRNFTKAASTEVFTIVYKKATDITNFYEAESIINKSDRVASGTDCSGGKRIDYWPNNTTRTFTIAEKGIYTVETNVNSARTGNPLYFYEGGTSSGNKLVTLAGTAGVSTYNFFVTSDNMTIGIGCSGGNNASAFDYFLIRKLGDFTEIVGATDFTTEWKQAKTTPVTLKPGDSYRYQFVNFSKATANDQNWQLIVANEDNTSDVLQIRADWYENINGSSLEEHQRGFSSDGNWWDIVPAKMNGALVDMTVTFTTDKKLTMTSTHVGSDGTTTRTYNYTSDNSNNIDLTDNAALNVYLTVALNYLGMISEDQTAVGVTTTAAGKGWATLYTDKGLDFSGVESLTAYTASLDNNTVTLNKVNDIQAGTGVVLKSSTTDANTTYSIPVIASSETPQGSLKGSTTEAKTATPESPIYILKLNNNNEAQFMRATSGSLAAGKAYLNGGQEAKALTVVFANDPTGIANVNAAEATLPVKRIVNGQLVIEKNGKRYNAAGAEF